MIDRDRESQLDEIARCYAHAAVDAFLEQGSNMTPETVTPATSVKARASSSVSTAGLGHVDNTGRPTSPANPGRLD